MDFKVMMVVSVDWFKIHGIVISRNKFTGSVWHARHIMGFYLPLLPTKGWDQF